MAATVAPSMLWWSTETPMSVMPNTEQARPATSRRATVRGVPVACLMSTILFVRRIAARRGGMGELLRSLVRVTCSGSLAQREHHAARAHVGLGEACCHVAAERQRRRRPQLGFNGGVLQRDGAARAVLVVDVDHDTVEALAQTVTQHAGFDEVDHRSLVAVRELVGPLQRVRQLA